MGLDMYLRATRYLMRSYKDESAISKKVAEAIGLPDADVREVSVLVGQWRKANQIHNWFVQNVQGGEDDCKPYYVGTDQLKELKDLCVRLLDTKDKKEAEEMLPNTEGFFFGSQDYDDYYWGDLMETVEIIDKCFSLPDVWGFEYQASW